MEYFVDGTTTTPKQTERVNQTGGSSGVVWQPHQNSTQQHQHCDGVVRSCDDGRGQAGGCRSNGTNR